MDSFWSKVASVDFSKEVALELRPKDGSCEKLGEEAERTTHAEVLWREQMCFLGSITPARTWCDRREEETSEALRRGWGRKASPASQPPRPVLRGCHRLAFWSPGPCHIRGCGFTVVGHERAGDLRLVTLGVVSHCIPV